MTAVKYAFSYLMKEPNKSQNYDHLNNICTMKITDFLHLWEN